MSGAAPGFVASNASDATDGSAGGEASSASAELTAPPAATLPREETGPHRTRDGVRSVTVTSLVPSRDLGIPASLLVLFGLYLGGLRWLDRGGLPMLAGERRGDDVRLAP